MEPIEKYFFVPVAISVGLTSLAILILVIKDILS